MSGLIIAAPDVYAGCGSTNVVITNATPQLCTLVELEMKHGYFDFVSSAPAFIPANTTSMPFILSQSLFGSDLTLRYTCGEGHTITMNSQHNYQIFFTGEVRATVVDSQGMSATFHATKGSCLWGEHASIQWLLNY